MDLIGNVSSGELMLALRATSPAVELMERSRRVAMSAAPAREKEAIYALGAHHRLPSIDLNKLLFSMRPSPVLGLPVLANGEMVREVAIQDVHRVGSHVLFVGSIIHESGQTEEQLGHVSGMYAEWLSRHHRPMRPV
jgi:flavin reductase (DIM6/NTAB) family NADH-FMN oxidoreductase RutF